MELDGIHHIGVNVRDLDRAEAFYTQVLGFRVSERYAESMRHLMLDTGGTGLHLFEHPDLNMDAALRTLSEEGCMHLAFGTTRKRFDGIVAELKEKEVPFRGPLVLGKGESVHFQDPDGNHLEIRCPAQNAGD
ncbi:VOC family protein [Nitrospina watsonii]|uniref:VOC family protein n=1 Tax=Nitrospina watsonii TaxID=1323948 RepID=A0ABN8VUU2_9BACT|nr:VOC family protein [Nitrospina watsonii]CAI2717612.1 VOC family protein [Nitrospina watsonii]